MTPTTSSRLAGQDGVRQEGHSEVDELADPAPAASDPHQPLGAEPTPEVAADEVAEASWESFPASDAPAWRQHD